MKRKISKQKKQILRKVVTIFCILALITILHYSIFKNFYSELIHMFISGLLLAYMCYLLSEFIPLHLKRKYFIIIWILVIGGYFIAVIFDPILKPYLDKALGVNTVATYPTSIMANSLCFIVFCIGWIIGGVISSF